MPHDNLKTRVAKARTFLFVPGDRPERFASAWRSRADVVILDLEAAVHPESKSKAREEVMRWMAQVSGETAAVVRINRAGSDDWALDRKMLSGMPPAGIMCSGAQLDESLSDLLADHGAKAPVILLVETATGIEQAVSLAAQPEVCRLAFGNMDYATELGLGDDRWGYVYPGSRLAVASKCAGLPSPIAGVTADIRDREVLDADIRFERSLGFGAKMCIHPQQVTWARTAFEVSPEEIAWAKRILAATRESHAVDVDGQMVDRPVIERARRLIKGE